MTALRPSDNHRAALCRLSYDAARAPYWPLGEFSLPRCFFDRDEDGMPVITCEGTRPNFLGDWKADFDQLDLTIDALMDPVPHGWGQAILRVFLRILDEFEDPTLAVGWNGHSMGASDALIGAALWKRAGRRLGRITAFEPGPVGRLGGLLDDEDVLITWVGEADNKLRRDPVPEATTRAHPVAPTWLAPQPGWSAIDMHEMANVSLALAAALSTCITPERETRCAS